MTISSRSLHRSIHRPLHRAVAIFTGVLVAGALAGVAPSVAVAADPPSGFVAVDPTRDVDTRIGRGGPRLSAGETRVVELTDVGPTVTAVVANMTVVEPAGAGHLTVTDCSPGPPTSALNFATGGATSNQVTVAVSADGGARVCVTASAPTDLLVDRVGHVEAAGASFRPRLVRSWDSRTDGGIGPDGVLEVDLADVLDADAVAWSGTITATDVRRPGHVAAWPCGSDRPETSVLNHVPGSVRANQVVVPVTSDDPRLCVLRTGAAQLVVDTTGVWGSTGGTSVSPFSPPRRFVDTRAGTRVVAGDVRRLHAPADAMLFLNVTATRAWADGWVAVHPCDTGSAGTSTLNVRPGHDVAVGAVVDARAGGVCASTSVPTDLVVDLYAVQAVEGAPELGASGVPIDGEPVPSATPTGTGGTVSACVVGPMDEADRERSALGLPPFRSDDRTTAFACHHAAEMARAGSIVHSTTVERDVVDACGVHAENIGVSSSGWGSMMSRWLASPLHRANIVNPLLERATAAYVSVERAGVVRWYGAMVFGGAC